jgi:hypothetical protein
MAKKTLTELDDTEFENLVFDLMTAHGMLNVTWRTPGSDGGRDIEGTVVHNDFSLTQTAQKWYVECKRYTGSVNWPTIYAKIAFAHSNAADVLLMCTSSKYTPTAINEVTKWNSSKAGPIIRLWPGHQIEILLSRHQDIAWKYGLENAPLPITGSTLELTLALSKCVTSHCSTLEFSDIAIPSMLRAAQAISGLLQTKMESVARVGGFEYISYQHHQFDTGTIEIKSDLKAIDGPSFDAIITYLVALGVKILSICDERNYSCKILCSSSVDDIGARYKSVLDAISLWGNFEYKVDDKQIFIKQR